MGRIFYFLECDIFINSHFYIFSHAIFSILACNISNFWHTMFLFFFFSMTFYFLSLESFFLKLSFFHFFSRNYEIISHAIFLFFAFDISIFFHAIFILSFMRCSYSLSCDFCLISHAIFILSLTGFFLFRSSIPWSYGLEYGPYSMRAEEEVTASFLTSFLSIFCGWPR